METEQEDADFVEDMADVEARNMKKLKLQGMC